MPVYEWDRPGPVAAHAHDGDAVFMHQPLGGSGQPHHHIILEKWSHDWKQRAGLHIDRWHMKPSDVVGGVL